jgi:acyl-coenzyme A thioesterase PaaI-like protein
MHAWQPQMDALRAEGKVVASGRRMATAEGRLFDADGKLYSHGTTTCMLFDLEPPRG